MSLNALRIAAALLFIGGIALIVFINENMSISFKQGFFAALGFCSIVSILIVAASQVRRRLR